MSLIKFDTVDMSKGFPEWSTFISELDKADSRDEYNFAGLKQYDSIRDLSCHIARTKTRGGEHLNGVAIKKDNSRAICKAPCTSKGYKECIDFINSLSVNDSLVWGQRK